MLTQSRHSASLMKMYIKYDTDTEEIMTRGTQLWILG